MCGHCCMGPWRPHHALHVHATSLSHLLTLSSGPSWASLALTVPFLLCLHQLALQDLVLTWHLKPRAPLAQHDLGLQQARTCLNGKSPLACGHGRAPSLLPPDLSHQSLSVGGQGPCSMALFKGSSSLHLHLDSHSRM